MFNSILVICTANICRSPLAERILRREFPDKKIDSAGIMALVNKPADEGAIAIASQHGLSLEGHRARQFTPHLGLRYELILAMEKQHLQHISRMAPEVSGKSMLLGYWLDQREVMDPFRRGDDAFARSYDLINLACQKWVAQINR
ncbi:MULTISPECIES: arsenate reductase/protein-tyrosine-phosphatase family protein [Pantoea]|uniref:protein-tyrosine-phosphatase n=1 Tax=Candidatus Pantoea multigeneris TaxID=2608357 RepID=A0ABX0REI1_9GAMM|nr:MULTISPECIES: hypothetical protein [Pantoea]NIF23023.1 protein tyrosine phosphatase [Pantoea multigeneris]